MRRLKRLFDRLMNAWRLSSSLDITESLCKTNTLNIDLVKNFYYCFENKDGGYDICYVQPGSDNYDECTFTVARLKGRNAGEIADAMLEILNAHSINCSIGDKECQEKPTNFVPYFESRP